MPSDPDAERAVATIQHILRSQPWSRMVVEQRKTVPVVLKEYQLEPTRDELLHNLGVGNTDKHGSSEHVPLLCSEHVPLLCTIHPGWAHAEAA